MTKSISRVLKLSTAAAALLLAAAAAYAQKGISGRVVEAGTGYGAIGAAVVVEGSSNGAVTDFDGNFTLNAPEGTTVVVSMIGFKEVKAPLSQGMVITLEEDTQLLEEVVVVGYGTVKKESLSGAVAVVKEEMLQEKGSLSSPVQALQGQVPGVIITRASSAPGDESWSMSLRGAVSANSTEPLVVIDGVAYECK